MREQVIERFVQEVEQRKLAPRELPRSVVVDHMPDFIDEVIGRLDLPSSSDAKGSFGEVKYAREHANVRWSSHYELATMVREYGAIRDAIRCHR